MRKMRIGRDAMVDEVSAMTDVAKIAEGLSEAQRAALDARGLEIGSKSDD